MSTPLLAAVAAAAAVLNAPGAAAGVAPVQPAAVARLRGGNVQPKFGHAGGKGGAKGAFRIAVPPCTPPARARPQPTRAHAAAALLSRTGAERPPSQISGWGRSGRMAAAGSARRRSWFGSGVWWGRAGGAVRCARWRGDGGRAGSAPR